MYNLHLVTSLLIVNSTVVFEYWVSVVFVHSQKFQIGCIYILLHTIGFGYSEVGCFSEESCNYTAMTDEMVRNRLVVGILDCALSQRLQLDAGLTLEKAKTMVSQREAVGEQQQLLKGTGTAETHSLDELQRRDRRKQCKSFSLYKFDAIE